MFHAEPEEFSHSPGCDEKTHVEGVGGTNSEFLVVCGMSETQTREVVSKILDEQNTGTAGGFVVKQSLFEDYLGLRFTTIGQMESFVRAIKGSNIKVLTLNGWSILTLALCKPLGEENKEQLVDICAEDRDEFDARTPEHSSRSQGEFKYKGRRSPADAVSHTALSLPAAKVCNSDCTVKDLDLWHLKYLVYHIPEELRPLVFVRTSPPLSCKESSPHISPTPEDTAVDGLESLTSESSRGVVSQNSTKSLLIFAIHSGIHTKESCRSVLERHFIPEVKKDGKFDILSESHMQPFSAFFYTPEDMRTSPESTNYTLKAKTSFGENERLLILSLFRFNAQKLLSTYLAPRKQTFTENPYPSRIRVCRHFSDKDGTSNAEDENMIDDVEAHSHELMDEILGALCKRGLLNEWDCVGSKRASIEDSVGHGGDGESNNNKVNDSFAPSDLASIICRTYRPLSHSSCQIVNTRERQMSSTSLATVLSPPPGFVEEDKAFELFDNKGSHGGEATGAWQGVDVKRYIDGSTNQPLLKDSRLNPAASDFRPQNYLPLSSAREPLDQKRDRLPVVVAARSTFAAQHPYTEVIERAKILQWLVELVHGSGIRGILLEQLTDRFLEQKQQILDPVSLGFQSIEHLIKSMDNEIIISFADDNNDRGRAILLHREFIDRRMSLGWDKIRAVALLVLAETVIKANMDTGYTVRDSGDMRNGTANSQLSTPVGFSPSLLIQTLHERLRDLGDIEGFMRVNSLDSIEALVGRLPELAALLDLLKTNEKEAVDSLAQMITSLLPIRSPSSPSTPVQSSETILSLPSGVLEKQTDKQAAERSLGLGVPDPAWKETLKDLNRMSPSLPTIAGIPECRDAATTCTSRTISSPPISTRPVVGSTYGVRGAEITCYSAGIVNVLSNIPSQTMSSPPSPETQRDCHLFSCSLVTPSGINDSAFPSSLSSPGSNPRSAIALRPPPLTSSYNPNNCASENQGLASNASNAPCDITRMIHSLPPLPSNRTDLVANPGSLDSQWFGPLTGSSSERATTAGAGSENNDNTFINASSLLGSRACDISEERIDQSCLPQYCRRSTMPRNTTSTIHPDRCRKVERDCESSSMSLIEVSTRLSTEDLSPSQLSLSTLPLRISITRQQLYEMIFDVVKIGCVNQAKNWERGEDLVELEEEEFERRCAEAGKVKEEPPPQRSRKSACGRRAEEGDEEDSEGEEDDDEEAKLPDPDGEAEIDERYSRRRQRKRQKREKKKRKKNKMRELERREGLGNAESFMGKEESAGSMEHSGTLSSTLEVERWDASSSSSLLSSPLTSPSRCNAGSTLQMTAQVKKLQSRVEFVLPNTSNNEELAKKRQEFRNKSIGVLVSSIKAEWSRTYGRTQQPLATYMHHFGFRRMKLLLFEVPNLFISGSGGFMRASTVEHCRAFCSPFPPVGRSVFSGGAKTHLTASGFRENKDLIGSPHLSAFSHLPASSTFASPKPNNDTFRSLPRHVCASKFSSGSDTSSKDSSRPKDIIASSAVLGTIQGARSRGYWDRNFDTTDLKDLQYPTLRPSVSSFTLVREGDACSVSSGTTTSNDRDSSLSLAIQYRELLGRLIYSLVAKSCQEQHDHYILARNQGKHLSAMEVYANRFQETSLQLLIENFPMEDGDMIPPRILSPRSSERLKHKEMLLSKMGIWGLPVADMRAEWVRLFTVPIDKILGVAGYCSLGLAVVELSPDLCIVGDENANCRLCFDFESKGLLHAVGLDDRVGGRSTCALLGENENQQRSFCAENVAVPMPGTTLLAQESGTGISVDRMLPNGDRCGSEASAVPSSLSGSQAISLFDESDPATSLTRLLQQCNLAQPSCGGHTADNPATLMTNEAARLLLRLAVCKQDAGPDSSVASLAYCKHQKILSDENSTGCGDGNSSDHDPLGSSRGVFSSPSSGKTNPSSDGSLPPADIRTHRTKDQLGFNFDVCGQIRADTVSGDLLLPKSPQSAVSAVATSASSLPSSLHHRK